MSARFDELLPFPDHSVELEGLIGRSSGEPQLSPDPVNEPMIRHWVEAMGDLGNLDSVLHLLDLEGLTSVVATNCEQRYGRPLVIGDRLLLRSVMEDITEPKRTALGTGRFVTTRLEFTAVPDADVPEEASPAEVTALAEGGERVAVMRFRILKYLPSSPAPAPPPRPPRPRPALTQDNAFWFEGARDHQLLIQRCTSCGTLRHPPLPACANCRSFDWDTVTASGRGTLYSFVVVHYPQVPSFAYPLAIGLVQLEEGTPPSSTTTTNSRCPCSGR